MDTSIGAQFEGYTQVNRKDRTKLLTDDALAPCWSHRHGTRVATPAQPVPAGTGVPTAPTVCPENVG